METNQQTLENNFAIHTDVYDGPFELALRLIEKRKLLVNDLALASITDDFIAHVRAQETFPVEETSHFIGISTTLILIKSKSLLPDMTLTEEESEDVEELKQRLAMYKNVCIASNDLGNIFYATPLISRGAHAPEIVFAPSRDMSLDTIARALETALSSREKPKQAVPEARVRNIASIREMMDKLTLRVQNSLTLSFREFLEHGKKEKVDVVISFLALLELIKQGAIEASQHDIFEDIRMTNTVSDAVPRYGE